ncbi:hypothetical protein WMY93_022903 [Mugilogobius chulae]|uniref:Uncharacterized protein n=1 Tax=Mugilogobius chulae TaxID=88201 RepID=A0AAW0NDU7_9GOBI
MASYCPRPLQAGLARDRAEPGAWIPEPEAPSAELWSKVRAKAKTCSFAVFVRPNVDTGREERAVLNSHTCVCECVLVFGWMDCRGVTRRMRLTMAFRNAMFYSFTTPLLN